MDLSQFSSTANNHATSNAEVNPTLNVPLDDGKLDPNAQYVDLSIKEGQQIRFYVETTNDDHGNQA